MVLPPPFHGKSVSHIHIVGKEATCLRTVSLGLKLGTLEEEEREKDGAKPNFFSMLLALCQLPLHACEHGRTPFEYICLLALNCTIHVHAGSLVKGHRSNNLPNKY
jgi:hypothetical protein